MCRYVQLEVDMCNGGIRNNEGEREGEERNKGWRNKC